MARTGRPPKPIEVHEAEGTLRASRHKRTSLRGGRPSSVLKPPTWMTVSQRAAFKELAGSQATVLDVADAPMVEAAAVLLDRARQASRAVGALKVPNRFGHDEPDPMLKVERDAWNAFRQFAEQIGVGPSARARLGAIGDEGQSADTAFPELREVSS